MAVFRSLLQTAAFMSLLGSAFSCRAQDLPEFPAATDQHKWLRQFEGKWVCDAECVMAPGQPVTHMKSVFNCHMLGDFWIINEMDAEGPFPMRGRQTIGYDPATGRYVGTWVDSVSSHLWHYKGSVSESGTKLVLEAEGPDMTEPGKTALYRDAYEFRSADHMVVTSSVQMPDGEWFTFMTGQSKRTAGPAEEE